jgi:crotonobetainyl-CoA:carnitine CoA-transferase CaiB-like acyl-CoA transferase
MAYAPTVQAETGFTANTATQFGGEGTTGEGRLRSDALSHADVHSGMQGAIAVLAALAGERTGRGQYIDIAMAAVMMYVNERVHVDLSGEDLGAEQPVLGAVDCPFFVSPDGDTFVSPMSLVGSLTFPFYLAAMRRPDLADDPRFRTPALRLANLAALHQIVQTWIWTFGDMASLDAQFDEAKIATGRLRDIRGFAQSQFARNWEATRQVSDRNGGTLTIPGAPGHFSTTQNDGGQSPQVPARQGEHNAEILAELGYDSEQIEALVANGTLIQPSRSASSEDAARIGPAQPTTRGRS